MAVTCLVRAMYTHRSVLILLSYLPCCHICSKFNSGIFAVPWEDTQKVLEELGVEMTVYDL